MDSLINIELTLEQFNHVKQILTQSKPSRTRLTQEEKNHIIYMSQRWLEGYCSDMKDDSLCESIIKKLK